jgi:dihydrofolate synthase/folylpolyglutamate synthase
MIPKTRVTAFVTKYKKDFERIKPSFFEMTVGLAFQYFSDEKADIAIVEVGMGGRLDSTNVITPLVSVITNIGLDHTQFLGDTLAKIAAEKAGIIKPGIPVVIGEKQPETRGVFRERANAGQSPIVFADEVYTSVFKGYSGNLRQWLTLDIYRNGKLFIENLRCPLRGLYQSKNIVAILQAAEVLNQSGYAIDEKDIRSGIQKVLAQTGLLGRWQTLSRNPLTICDCGHNPAGMTEVVRQINDTPHRKLHFVIGMVNDKDIDGVLQLLPPEGIYYFCKAGIPRGLDARLLKEKAGKYHLKGDVYTSVKNALAAATVAAAADDLVFVGGSCFTVAEVV